MESKSASGEAQKELEAIAQRILNEGGTNSHEWLRGAARRILTLAASQGVSAPAVAEWKPIETAPKDGTWLLAYVDGGMFVLHWDSDTVSHSNSYRWRDAECFPFTPSHWMKLPDPPSGLAALRGDT